MNAPKKKSAPTEINSYHCGVGGSSDNGNADNDKWHCI